MLQINADEFSRLLIQFDALNIQHPAEMEILLNGDDMRHTPCIYWPIGKPL